MARKNWTDYERPCFAEFDPDFHSMTKEQLVDYLTDMEDIHDCDWYDEESCHQKRMGLTWATCSDGACSRHCDWKPEDGDA